MKNFLFPFFFSTSLLFAQSDLEKANSAYSLRSAGSIKNKADNIQIDLAIKHYESAIKRNNSLEATEGILKSYYFSGQYVSSNIDEKKKIFNKAVKLGEKFILEYPESPGIRYWYLVNLGSWAEAYGVIAAARSGFADTMRVHSEKIIDMDSMYNNGGGYFMLGVVHLRAPYIPFFLPWPDKVKAEKLLESATKTGENTLPQKFNYAKVLYKNNQKIKALKFLNEVIKSNPSGENKVEEWDQILEAKKFLMSIEE